MLVSIDVEELCLVFLFLSSLVCLRALKISSNASGNLKSFLSNFLTSTKDRIGKGNPSDACCDSKIYKKYVLKPTSLSVALRTGNKILIFCATSARVGGYLRCPRLVYVLASTSDNTCSSASQVVKTLLDSDYTHFFIISAKILGSDNNCSPDEPD